MTRHPTIGILLAAALAAAIAGVQVLAGPGPAEIPTEEIIVYTAHQGFLSRIYFLRQDGSVATHFEYVNYFFADVEVVDNEVYVAEAFAPRVLKVDLHTGDLEVIVDDWSLFYFYGLVFDGTYWYVDEWDLNRYQFDGTKVGTASFDESMAGAVWDGHHLWTLNDEENSITCWDISDWPNVIELPEQAFAPPTPDSRGLWYDGEFLWTAESIEDTPGQIYRFDFEGNVVDQWLEPAYRGWGACVVSSERFVLTVGRAALSWTHPVGAHTYDVVRGDLRALRGTAGNFILAVEECLANDRASLSLPYTTDPDPGTGDWFLVRGESISGPMTYDSGEASQIGSRDWEIDAASGACPHSL